MAREGSTIATIVALLANAGVAVAKFVAAAFTGSASMLAEGFHSVADTGNQALLLYGKKRSEHKADTRYPFGYSHLRYVYAFLVTVVLFSLGGVLSLIEGYKKIVHPHPVESPVVAGIVLAIAVLFEGASLRTAVRESRKEKSPEESWPDFIHRTKTPELAIVVMEDSAALAGLAVAGSGIALSEFLSNPVYDGAASMAIGVLLCSVALVLGREMTSLLMGEAARPETVNRICAELAKAPGVIRVLNLRTLHLGPDELLVGAKVEIGPRVAGADVARLIDEAERQVRSCVPIVHTLYLEPDLSGQPATSEGTAGG